MTEIKTIELPNGAGCIRYRLPNVIEQMRFFSQTKWYSEECVSDVYLRAMRAIEVGREFIVEVQGLYNSIDELLSDRQNTNSLLELAWDLAGSKLSEPTKKL